MFLIHTTLDYFEVVWGCACIPWHPKVEQFVSKLEVTSVWPIWIQRIKQEYCSLGDIYRFPSVRLLKNPNFSWHRGSACCASGTYQHECRHGWSLGVEGAALQHCCLHTVGPWRTWKSLALSALPIPTTSRDPKPGLSQMLWYCHTLLQNSHLAFGFVSSGGNL